MANNRFQFEGLDELRAELRRLPSKLTGKASGIVNEASDRAFRQALAGYERHRRSGDLAKKLTVRKVAAGAFSTGVEVRNTSPLAFIFENGSQARHTAIGANRGSMPPGHVFIPAMAPNRRWMYEQLKNLVRSEGLEVTGDE